MEKKRTIILILIVIEIIIIISCVLAYFLSSRDEGQEELQTAKQQEKVVVEPIIDIENYPKVDAALPMQNLANAFESNFTGKNIDSIRNNYTGENMVYIKLVDGYADIVISKEPTAEEMEYAQRKGIDIEYTPIVIDPFVFYTSNNNSIRGLSLDQIRRIYTEKVTRWSEVGGDDFEIKAFQRNANSNDQKAMISMVMQDTEISNPLTEEIDANGVPVNIVSDYDNGDYSLGYSFYSYANTVYDISNKDVLDGIKLLKVDDIEPSYENIQNGKYTLAITYYIAIRKDSEEGGTVRKIRDAMISNRGKMVAKEAGYVTAKP